MIVHTWSLAFIGV